ncbi:unnamed protein product [Symbiodinium natans]|uniref:Uncharacterized protein n=1 Tax=Symbiodinium natans TaxID=878477 RepID=A0A812UNX6_9DINO|nr:unnamed protein product [Symbiodinium natans]
MQLPLLEVYCVVCNFTSPILHGSVCSHVCFARHSVQSTPACCQCRCLLKAWQRKVDVAFGYSQATASGPLEPAFMPPVMPPAAPPAAPPAVPPGGKSAAKSILLCVDPAARTGNFHMGGCGQVLQQPMPMMMAGNTVSAAVLLVESLPGVVLI